ncbi:hemocyte protein-glutamine gamma-glutamyltransferase isoform X2 [Lingula anatina]|uniref:protein-glutamine gamma-glutamyltransferase n=1 Tax=Lingula anatina TaxID=7574 RepID=A0A1S3HAG6_LINAN|nr:hemocyte protein-glutamine gamma-glutamyltransferase isoform X2 [Lingula anatina]|eukprot:XP_013382446.1 hemocyte protein-glutamine gamma-glutamyltransferase isoform X2 [Lingula anatina]
MGCGTSKGDTENGPQPERANIGGVNANNANARSTNRGTYRVGRWAADTPASNPAGTTNGTPARPAGPVASKPETERAPVEIEKEVTAVKCKDIDFKIDQNSKEHHTDQYEATKTWLGVNAEPQKPWFIVRRGQDFVIDLCMDGKFDKDNHDVKLTFEFGANPKPGEETLVSFKVSAKDKPKAWGAEILSVTGNDQSTVSVSVATPPNCKVGKWTLNVDTIVKKKDGTVEVLRYAHPNKVYILFNPWCEDDQVYMPEKDHREEYVLAETGRIYTGSKKKIRFRPWNFGQFEDFVLDCCLSLLDNCGLAPSARGNPVQIVRKISAIVNAPDDNGVLVGNWSGNYEGGTRPTKWAGSVAILLEYCKTKKPVQFGQCWVFSGVVTTVCRCLGIPCRSVTNFSSAHDTDGNITLSAYMDAEGEYIDSWCSDSLWNFHVWNDVWMCRPKLPPGHDGWQAIDATPQELSDGVFCAGPCSLNAIKAGQVYLPYDGPFIFAEVNGDKVIYQQQVDTSWAVQKIYKELVGYKVCTKKVLSPDMEDITPLYKFSEGTDEERAALKVAVSHTNVYSGLNIDYHGHLENNENQDITFLMYERDSIVVGEDFDIDLIVSNQSSEQRTLNVSLGATVVYYTGVYKKNVATDNFHIVLAPGEKEKKVSITVSPADYLDHLADQTQMKARCKVRVEETNQIFVEEDDFDLTVPDLEFEYVGGDKNDLHVGQPFQLKFGFTNPLPKPLTQCMFIVEGPGLQKAMEYKIRDVPPGEKAEQTVTLTPKTPGEKNIIISFDCQEPCDVNGIDSVYIEE